jgi:hypothetical protein
MPASAWVSKGWLVVRRSQAYAAWATNAIQLDRVGQGQHAPKTLLKSTGALKRYLGFCYNVMHHGGPVTSKLVLNGALLAEFVAFRLDIRCVERAARSSRAFAAVSPLPPHQARFAVVVRF